MNQRLSQLRSKLQRTEEEIRQLLQQFQGRSPLLPASLYTMKRRCGKEGCRCARGQLHATTVLSYRGGEKPQTITPPADRLETFKAITDEYRRVRQARPGWSGCNRNFSAPSIKCKHCAFSKENAN